MSIYNGINYPTMSEIGNEDKTSSWYDSELEKNLDRINMWIGNCDQKASFLLALLGVAATVFCTSDFFSEIKKQLMIPFKEFLASGNGGIDWYRAAVAFFLLLSIAATLVALIKLIKCLKANIDRQKFYKEGMEKKSFLFFKSISEMPYNDFKGGPQNIANVANDLCSQVYTNATICTKKFKYYNQAISSMLVAISSVLITVILLLFL